MNYMKVQVPLLLNAFNSRHSTCADSRGVGLEPGNQALQVWIERKGKRVKVDLYISVICHGRILFGDM